jgi:hypothetical protein
MNQIAYERGARTITGYPGHPDLEEDPEDEDVLMNVLADLRHWAEGRGIDFDRCENRAHSMFCEDGHDDDSQT